MDSVELANAVESVCREARTRILIEGKSQYENAVGGVHHQTFETENVEFTFVELENELMDMINYAAMLILKLRVLHAAAEKVV